MNRISKIKLIGLFFAVFLFSFSWDVLAATGSKPSSKNIAIISLQIPPFKTGGVATAGKQLGWALGDIGYEVFFIGPDKTTGVQHKADEDLHEREKIKRTWGDKILVLRVLASQMGEPHEIVTREESLYWINLDRKLLIVPNEPTGRMQESVEQEIPILHKQKSLTEKAMQKVIAWIMHNEISVLHCQYPSDIDFTIDLKRRLRARDYNVIAVYQDHSTGVLKVIDKIRKIDPSITYYGKVAKRIYEIMFGPRFSEFDAVFCSTESAVENYRTLQIHENILLLPIIINLEYDLLELKEVEINPTERVRLLELFQHRTINQEGLDFALQKLVAQNNKNQLPKHEEEHIAFDNSTDVLIHFGRIDPRKNVKRIFHVFKKLIDIKNERYQKSKDIKLVLMGPYQEFEDWHPRAGQPQILEVIEELGLEDHVIITGRFQQKSVLAILDYYKKVGVRAAFFHASHLETFGMTAREAQGKKFPVIGFDTNNSLMAPFVKRFGIEESFRLFEDDDAVVSDLEKLFLQNQYKTTFSEEVLERGARVIKENFAGSVVGSAADDYYKAATAKIVPRSFTKDDRPVIFTDLANSLIDDRATTRSETVQEVLQKCEAAKIPIIPVSVKTKREQVVILRELGLRIPFVVENGGAIYIPIDYFQRAEINYHRVEDDYYVIEIGKQNHDEQNMVKMALEKAAEKTGVSIEILSEMNLGRIMYLTGLSNEQAVRAKQFRKYSEPFMMVPDPDDDALREFRTIIDNSDMRLEHGGQFWTITRKKTTKEAAVKILLGLFRQEFGERVISIGIGDAQNDVSLLRTVNIPVVVFDHKTGRANRSLVGLFPDARLATAGPNGWADEVNRIFRFNTTDPILPVGSGKCEDVFARNTKNQ